MAWSKLVKKIPAKVQISKKVTYNVRWADKLETKSYDLYGETDLNAKQITILKNMSPKQTIETYIHECLHAFSHEYEINLTENQILAMEKTFYYVLKNDNIFKGKRNERKRKVTK